MGQEFSASDITSAPVTYSAADIHTGDEPATFSGVASLMGSQAKRAVGAAWDTISSTPGLLMHPVDAMQKAFSYTSDAVGRVQKATSAGDAKDAILSGLGAIPLAGPAAEQIAREIDGGNYAEAIGHAAALRIIGEAPKAIAGATRTAAAIPAAVRAAAAANPELAGAAADLGKDALGVISPRAANAVSAAGRAIRMAKNASGLVDQLRAPAAAPPAPGTMTIQPQARIATPPPGPAVTPAVYAPPATSTTPLPAAPVPAPLNPYFLGGSTADPAALATRVSQGQAALAPNPTGALPSTPAPVIPPPVVSPAPVATEAAPAAPAGPAITEQEAAWLKKRTADTQAKDDVLASYAQSKGLTSIEPGQPYADFVKAANKDLGKKYGARIDAADHVNRVKALNDVLTSKIANAAATSGAQALDQAGVSFDTASKMTPEQLGAKTPLEAANLLFQLKKIQLAKPATALDVANARADSLK